MHAILNRVTNKFTFVVLIGLIFPTLAMYPSYDANDGKVDVVVIDAGHGGKDPGNLGTGRYRSKEKDVSLNVSLLLGKYIEENLEGVKVIYTRDTDEFLELYERTALANRNNADLFISIHCNSAGARSAYGTETFVMGWDRAAANLEVSKRENSVIFLEDDYEANYEGFDPNSPASNIATRLAQSAYLDQSIEFATLVQEQFKDRVQRRDRGVKQSVLYVLDYTAMPSALIELGFLSNSNEEDFLNTTRGQELMASAIYRAFKEYKLHRDALDEGIVMEHHDETPVVEEPVIQIVERKPVFKVQIAVSSTLKDCTPENFNGLEGVGYYQEGRLYKYTFGEFATQSEAEEARKEAVAAGFQDAYLIAFLGDDKISVSEASRLLQ